MLNISRQQAFLLLVLILFVVVLFAVALVGGWVSLGGPVAAAFAQADHVFKERFRWNRMGANPMETFGCICQWDTLSGGLTIRGHILGKDGIFASALVVEMLARTGERISELRRRVWELTGRLYSLEEGIPATPEMRVAIPRRLREAPPLDRGEPLSDGVYLDDVGPACQQPAGDVGQVVQAQAVGRLLEQGRAAA